MEVHKYFHRWLKIPLSGTLHISMLSKSKFGLDIIDPSTKFIQCKAIYRNHLKNSKHEDTRVIHEMTSHTNIQYDRFNSTREIVKSMRSDKQDRIEQIYISRVYSVISLRKRSQRNIKVMACCPKQNAKKHLQLYSSLF